jgi:SP family sugar porter-like MFS transporter
MPSYNLKYIWSICLSAALGGLLFGYDWVVIGGAKPFYEVYFNLTSSYQIGWAMSSALVGCLIGSVFSGGTSDRFGRKRLLILSAILFTISAIGTALSFSFFIFVVFRLLGGIGIGLASNLSPMYIAEVSPAEFRGKFVSINQLTIVIGILAAQLVNWLIAESVSNNATTVQILYSWNGQIGWRWMFGAETIPAILFFISMIIIPESPRWLVKNANNDYAEKILTKIGGKKYSENKFNEIQISLKNDIEKVDFKELFEPGMIKILLLGFVLAVFQQWCGINVIFNYAEEVFSAAGYGVNDILFNIVITGIVNLLFTFVAIKTVDKWGRKPLMLVGARDRLLCHVAGSGGMGGDFGNFSQPN